MAGGRPTIYTPELASYVCKMIATHTCGLRKLTAMYDAFPSQSTIYDWIYDHSEFSGLYLEARRVQALLLADSMLSIPDEIPTFEDKDGNERIDAGMLGKAKLDYEILKWHASKLAPKVYGVNKVDDTQTPADTLSKIQALVADLNKTNISDV